MKTETEMLKKPWNELVTDRVSSLSVQEVDAISPPIPLVQDVGEFHVKGSCVPKHTR